MEAPNNSPETISTAPDGGPVLNAEVDSISELFSRGLETWTEDDMTRMIEELRKRRVDFLTEDKAKKTKAKAPKISTTGKSADEIMAQLGLDL